MSVDNLVGQRLGQCELKELLGAGGMGAVYRAFQANLKREVAVKVLPSGLTAMPRGRPPVRISPVTRSLAVSTMLTVPDFSLGTYASGAAGRKVAQPASASTRRKSSFFIAVKGFPCVP